MKKIMWKNKDLWIFVEFYNFYIGLSIYSDLINCNYSPFEFNFYLDDDMDDQELEDYDPDLDEFDDEKTLFD